MSDQPYRQQRGMLDRIKDATGIYGLGFERESFLGFILPWIIVIVVGGIGGLLIWRWL
ncbi:MAG TPA: hypothetical protein VIL01_01000 [Thermomicrobiales bacterium]